MSQMMQIHPTTHFVVPSCQSKTGWLLSGVVGEAWQTANELLSNAQSLERILEARQAQSQHSALDNGEAEGSSRHEAKVSSKVSNQDWEALWSQQERLWLRSQELHRESHNLSFTKP